MNDSQDMTLLGLTGAQARCLAMIRDVIARDGIAPSYSEIRDALGFKSKSHVHQIVCELEKRGAIVRRSGSARSVRPVPGLFMNHACPHCGGAIGETV